MNVLATLLLAALTPTATPADAPTPADRDDLACYAVADGRASVPLRENYLTYSPILDTISRKQVFLGERVQGENKVLVYTPHAKGWIGIVRHTFTREVPRARCEGPALYQPAYDALLTWVEPLPGVADAPRILGAFSSWGCFATKKPHRMDDNGKVTVPAGQVFFAVRGEKEGGYTTALTIIDADNGAVIGATDTRRVEQVPVSRCAEPAAYRDAR